MQSAIPNSPWDNPQIDEGVYLAAIKEVICRPYRCNTGQYIRMAFWIPQVEQHVVTHFYFPAEGGVKSVKRLGRLCQHLGLAPQDALESPKEFVGREVAVTIRMFQGVGQNEGTTYPDVELFLSPDVITKEGKLGI